MMDWSLLDLMLWLMKVTNAVLLLEISDTYLYVLLVEIVEILCSQGIQNWGAF